MRRTTVIQWLLSLLAFSVLLGFSSFFVWVYANPQRLTGELSLPGNRGAVIAERSVAISLDTNAGYITDATLTVVGTDFEESIPLNRATQPWQAETTWRAPATMQPYTLTAHFTAFDGTTHTSDPLDIDVVPAGTIAYVEAPLDGGAPSVYVMHTDGSDRHLWAENAIEPAWGPDGALYFVRAGAVWKQTAADTPADVVAGTQVGVVDYSLGDPIALVDKAGRLVLRHSDGGATHIPLGVDVVEDVAWHPDGETLIVSARTGDDLDLMLWSQPAATSENVTTQPVSDTQPAWSPDGTEIVFTAPVSETSDVTQINWLSLAPESKDRMSITKVSFGADEASWNPSGDWIVYVGQNTPSPASREIILQRIRGSSPYTVQITRTDAAIHSPAWRLP